MTPASTRWPVQPPPSLCHPCCHVPPTLAATCCPSCFQELSKLLLEERLAGATLLIMANKQDVPGALSKEAIAEVGWGAGGRCRGRCRGQPRVHSSACTATAGRVECVGMLCGAVDAEHDPPPLPGTQFPCSHPSVRLIPGTQALQLEALVGRQWSIVACSAVDGSGLLEGFQWLVRDIAGRIYLLE